MQVWPSIGTAVAIAASFVLFSRSLRSIPFGTAYAVWTGTRAVGSIVIGMVFFGESAGACTFTCLTLIVLGTLGLRLVTPS